MTQPDIPAVSIIVDIDGTLADCTHRLGYIGGKPKDWPAFFAAMSDDVLIEPVARLLRAISWDQGDSRVSIVLCSGRPDNYRAQTEEWLDRHSIKRGALYMRKAGDFRDDGIVKKELLDQIRADGWNPFIAIDDRQRVVDMWRANGLVCLQCAPGNF